MNVAAGPYSFAAGTMAVAMSPGTFVWADSSTIANGPFTSNPTPDEFDVLATGPGGASFTTSFQPTPYNGLVGTGCYINSALPFWTCASSREVKENFATVDTRWVLDQLASLEITTWNYKGQSAHGYHMGPVAQDFYAAFGLGETAEAITGSDASAVALAAIQGLYEVVKEKEASIAALETTLAEQQTQIEGLQAEVTALKIGGAAASMGLLSPATLFSALACLLAGAAFLRSRKQARE